MIGAGLEGGGCLPRNEKLSRNCQVMAGRTECRPEDVRAGFDVRDDFEAGVRGVEEQQQKRSA
jgi:hypothetical protein